MTGLALNWDLIGEQPTAIAVSGGADSFALLHAARARGLPTVALTVDHGLREGSPTDAAVVAAWCAEHGVPHETLRWEGEKPKTGVQAAARAARYRLLCEASERLGLERLATGHTMDDQAETVFMRLRRGAGRGLAAMPPRRKIASGPGEPVELLRPMLSVRRAEARVYAEAHGLPVRDDPGNDDEGFERVRGRAVLGALEEQGLLTAEALAATAAWILKSQLSERVTALRAWKETETDVLSDGTARVLHWDQSSFAAASWEPLTSADGAHDYEARVALLHQLCNAIGGSSTRSSGVPPERLPYEGRISLSGTLVVTDDGTMFVLREPAALLGRADGTPGLAPVPAAPGSRHLFDRRFVVIVPADAPPGLVLRPLGQLVPRDVATSTLARARVSTLPVLSEGGRIVLLPEPAERAVRAALPGWKGAADVLPPEGATFPARSLLAERFAGEVIRY